MIGQESWDTLYVITTEASITMKNNYAENEDVGAVVMDNVREGENLKISDVRTK